MTNSPKNLSNNAYFISAQPNSQRAAIGGAMFKICYQVLVYLSQLLGALLTRVFAIAIVASLTPLAVLYLIGAVIFGKKKSYGIKEKQAVPFCRQRSEGETSVLFTFLILSVTHISSWSWALPRRETLLQSKETPTAEEVEMDMAYL